EYSQVHENKTLIVYNKCDINASSQGGGTSVQVSALTGEGLDRLRARILEAIDVDVIQDRPEITNIRHIALLERAKAALDRARAAALTDGHSLSEEFVLADLQDARSALEEITGKRTPDDVLEHIFARFCIGK